MRGVGVWVARADGVGVRGKGSRIFFLSSVLGKGHAIRACVLTSETTLLDSLGVRR